MSKIQGFHLHPRPAPTVSDALLARYQGFQVANVSDAMSRTTGTSALRPFHQRSGAMAGRALTVRTRPGDNLLVHQAIDTCQSGDVIVVDAGGVGPNAIIGEIMLALLIARGAAGIVIDGLIRDSDTIAQHTLPVYARGVSHRGPYKDGPGELHVPVSIDGMVVRPGDIVIGDGDGLLAIAPEEAEDIAARVEAIQRVEADALQAIAEGRADRSWVMRTLREKGVV
ncbi:RraA family protein [Pseudorhodoferax sp. Leaf267]|uniref:RraA family protein n=1 Tax=Pseudorhodoferax sp. Leaf267 TaxID=1736316 RepID=UPI0006FAF001|nr:RraA family protein [Pseudorhodoferax sp. Leaf267]KQP13264.1 dimethylmenaquinone methyltransferase [Pseudorhodoferax sp. Leaf267]